MNELDKKLDEILGKPSIDMSTEIREAWGKAHQQLKSLLKEVCEEVIGEDEDLGIRISDRVPAEISSPIIERNKFRAKIRVKLNEIIR